MTLEIVAILFRSFLILRAEKGDQGADAHLNRWTYMFELHKATPLKTLIALKTKKFETCELTKASVEIALEFVKRSSPLMKTPAATAITKFLTWVGKVGYPNVDTLEAIFRNDLTVIAPPKPKPKLQPASNSGSVHSFSAILNESRHDREVFEKTLLQATKPVSRGGLAPEEMTQLATLYLGRPMKKMSKPKTAEEMLARFNENHRTESRGQGAKDYVSGAQRR